MRRTAAVFGIVALVAWFASSAHADDARSVARLGSAAPAFVLPVVQGSGSGTLADHRGKVVILKFWATYCGYCASIRPALAKFASANASSVSVLAISSQGKAKLMRYLRTNRIGLAVLHDRGAHVARRYRASATPTLMVIDQCGVLRFHQSGTPAAKRALALARELVQAAKDPRAPTATCD